MAAVGGAMSDWLAERWQLLRRILDRPWLRFCAILWAGVSAYDLLASQLLPAGLAEQLPKVREVVSMTSGWLPWWAWGWIGTALLAGAAIEYAARLHEATKPARRQAQLPKSPIEITFDPDDESHVRHRNGVTRFYVGVHNASDTRTNRLGIGVGVQQLQRVVHMPQGFLEVAELAFQLDDFGGD